jgi:UDP-N-acetylmuramoyl-tripeptide--D-alanyl-D-alanine ligase
MEAALRTLAGVDAPRKTAFLGRMAELGEHAKQYHRDIAQLASELGVDLIAVETDLYEVQPVTLDQAQQHLAELGVGDAALIKASRSVGLERLV